MTDIWSKSKGIILTLTVWFLVVSCDYNGAYQSKFQFRQTNFCANQIKGDLVANPDDCKLFFLCGENGEAVPGSCPSNMLFNSVSQICDTADKANCQILGPSNPVPAPAPSPTPTPDTTPNANQFCTNIYRQQPESNALVFIANSRNCYQYYMCYHGQALLQECSLNLYWNSKIGKCDLPSNVNCFPPADDTNAIQISPPVEDPLSGDYSGCPLYGHHIFPHKERCDFFIYCVKGYAILQKCPFYHYFDVESSRCQWRTRALCVKDLNLKFRKN